MAVKRLSPVRVAFGENVCRRRLALGLTQKQFAKLAGVHRSYLIGIELRIRNPSLTVIFDLARAAKVRVAVLMRGV